MIRRSFPKIPISTALLVSLGVVLLFIGVNGNPMLLIYPMWMFTYLLRNPLKDAARRFPLAVAFIGCGVFFGMLTEIFAIFNNLSLPPEKRILLSPDPILDMVYGLFYYSAVIVTWYLLLRWRRYSKVEVFILTGVLGIFTEEMGQVFLRIFTVPITGFLYALIVATVYGIFPMLTCLINEDRFKQAKESNIYTRSTVASVALFVQWAAYGLAVLPVLKAMCAARV